MSAEAAAKPGKRQDRDADAGAIGYYARRSSRGDIVASAVTQLRQDLKKIAGGSLKGNKK